MGYHTREMENGEKVLAKSITWYTSLGTYGYPSCSIVMANHSFQLKYRYG